MLNHGPLNTWTLHLDLGLRLGGGGVRNSSLVHKGPSINNVGTWEGEGSNIGQNCRGIVLKTADMGEGGYQKSEKNAAAVYGWSHN